MYEGVCVCVCWHTMQMFRQMRGELEDITPKTAVRLMMGLRTLNLVAYCFMLIHSSTFLCAYNLAKAIVD